MSAGILLANAARRAVRGAPDPPAPPEGGFAVDFAALPDANRQANDWAWYAANIRNAPAGTSYIDPHSGVRVTKLTDATTPVANPSVIHAYSEAGPQLSLPWSESPLSITGYTFVEGVGNGWRLFDYTRDGTASNWRTPIRNGGELRWCFSRNLATPELAYTFVTGTLYRVNYRTNEQVDGDIFPFVMPDQGTYGTSFNWCELTPDNRYLNFQTASKAWHFRLDLTTGELVVRHENYLGYSGFAAQTMSAWTLESGQIYKSAGSGAVPEAETSLGLELWQFEPTDIDNDQHPNIVPYPAASSSTDLATALAAMTEGTHYWHRATRTLYVWVIGGGAPQAQHRPIVRINADESHMTDDGRFAYIVIAGSRGRWWDYETNKRTLWFNANQSHSAHVKRGVVSNNTSNQTRGQELLEPPASVDTDDQAFTPPATIGTGVDSISGGHNSSHLRVEGNAGAQWYTGDGFVRFVNPNNFGAWTLESGSIYRMLIADMPFGSLDNSRGVTLSEFASAPSNASAVQVRSYRRVPINVDLATTLAGMVEGDCYWHNPTSTLYVWAVGGGAPDGRHRPMIQMANDSAIHVSRADQSERKYVTHQYSIGDQGSIVGDSRSYQSSAMPHLGPGPFLMFKSDRGVRGTSESTRRVDQFMVDLPIEAIG